MTEGHSCRMKLFFKQSAATLCGHSVSAFTPCQAKPKPVILYGFCYFSHCKCIGVYLMLDTSYNELYKRGQCIEYMITKLV